MEERVRRKEGGRDEEKMRGRGDGEGSVCECVCVAVSDGCMNGFTQAVFNFPVV